MLEYRRGFWNIEDVGLYTIIENFGSYYNIIR